MGTFSSLQIHFLEYLSGEQASGEKKRFSKLDLNGWWQNLLQHLISQATLLLLIERNLTIIQSSES